MHTHPGALPQKLSLANTQDPPELTPQFDIQAELLASREWTMRELGGFEPSCSVLGLHQMVYKTLSNTPTPKDTHTPPGKEDDARPQGASVQMVPLPSHSLAPPLLPPSPPAGFSTRPSISLADFILFVHFPILSSHPQTTWIYPPPPCPSLQASIPSPRPSTTHPHTSCRSASVPPMALQGFLEREKLGLKAV